MHRSLCICALLPRLETSTRVVFILHQLEANKPTNTGLMAARHADMHEHAVEQAQAADAAARAYIQDTVGGTSSADQLTKLADLKAQGVLSDDEYQKMKAQVIGS